MTTQQIHVPDIGADEAEVIEWLVQVGDRIEIDDSLLVLESDKASMEVPSTLAGIVETLLVSIGDAVSEGVPIVVIRVDSAAEAVLPETGDSDGDIETAADQRDDQVGHEEQDSVVNEPSREAKTAETAHQTLLVPDIGTDDGVEVIEISVSVGDQVSEGDTLIVLESDKASMEIPSEFSGEITALMVTVGDTLRQGDVIGELVAQAAHEAPVSSSVAVVSTDTSSSTPPRPVAATPAAAPAESMAKKAPAVAPGTAVASLQESAIANSIYAGPAVRKLAREFSIPLDQVQGSGPRSRILKEDLQAFVQHKLHSPQAAVTTGSGIPAVPAVDFSAFGSVRTEELSKIGKVTATNMQRSWLNVPHVTQFDDADITDLEAFRGALKEEATRRGTKLTPLPFLLKACAIALRENPKFNASLAPDGQSIIFKEYIHIGFAVDTPAGLLVPVIRDVDTKGLWDLSEEVLSLAAAARDKKLKPAQMQGACFTISSLGALGGKGFTPIVNAPEVGILGVAKASIQPVWNGSEFLPRNLLPLSLSYDHRVINGADGGRFMNQVVALLSDIRRFTL